MTLAIVKLGGSVITNKDEDRMQVREDVLHRLSSELFSAYEQMDLILVHGAGAFGHVPAKRYFLHEGFSSSSQIYGVCETHACMARLNEKVVSILCKNGLPCMGFQPSSSGFLKNGSLKSFQTGLVKSFVSLGIVPVSYGDVLLDESSGFNIMSGDLLVPFLARELNADLVVYAADVNGVYDKDPDDEDANFVPVLTPSILKDLTLGSSNATDVTGGMKSKIESLLHLSDFNIRVQVVSGLKEDHVKRALQGDHVGTIIKKD